MASLVAPRDPHCRLEHSRLCEEMIDLGLHTDIECHSVDLVQTLNDRLRGLLATLPALVGLTCRNRGIEAQDTKKYVAQDWLAGGGALQFQRLCFWVLP